MKRRLLWFIELFVWLLILFSVSSLIIFAKVNYKKSFNTYQIFLPDVDGLIIGSPVKFMGIQIGYINQLDIVGEDTYVNFIITDADVKIPRGSTATVEFSGLGGSKSLELYPPSSEEKEYSKFIIPQPPKRIHDSLGLLNDMFESAVDIAYDISHFMDKLGMLKSEQGTGNREQEKVNGKWKMENGKEENHSTIQPFNRSTKQTPINELLKKYNDWLDKAQKQCDKFNKKFKKKEVEKNGQGNGKN